MATIRVEPQGPWVRVTLDRPDVRNAFNEAVIAELTAAFRGVGSDARAVVLAGAGPVFCAGADVEWMRRSRSRSEAENAADARLMADMYRAVDECPVPVIVRVQGAAVAGGAGLAAAADIAVAAADAVFGFTEVRLGIIPAVISTYVLPRIGSSAARRYFLTGERFGAEEARAMGLVHEVVPAQALDAAVERLLGELSACGPAAVREAKKLIRETASLGREAALEQALRAIARIRISPEGQEGLGAFLEKRKPNWT